MLDDRDEWCRCKTCKTRLVSGPCPDDEEGCMVAHMVCPECRKVPCDVCGAKRKPEAPYGVCDDCVKQAVLWAVRQARANPVKSDSCAAQDYSMGDPNNPSKYI